MSSPQRAGATAQPSNTQPPTAASFSNKHLDSTSLESARCNFCFSTRILYGILIVLEATTVIILWKNNFSSPWSPSKLFSHKTSWIYYILSITQFITVAFSYKFTVRIANDSISEENIISLNRLKLLQFVFIAYFVADIICLLDLLIRKHVSQCKFLYHALYMPFIKIFLRFV